MKKEIWYLCDGEKPDCKKTYCYKNVKGEACCHTSDIDHAVNFKKSVHGGRTSYWETSRN